MTPKCILRIGTSDPRPSRYDHLVLTRDYSEPTPVLISILKQVVNQPVHDRLHYNPYEPPRGKNT